MPSPFPGMDPWLEDPALWPDVHHNAISEMQAVLNRQVRPRYHVRIEERIYVSDESDPGREVIIPDLKIRERERTAGWHESSAESSEIAVAEPLILTTLLDEEIHEACLTIVDHTDRSVIAVIEVLSPTNKHPGSKGEAVYRAKRSEVMNSSSNFVEIDLLRAGRRMSYRGRAPTREYLIHVSRVGERPKGRVWLVGLRERLPAISIPLREDDDDVSLDLQCVLEAVYDRAAYDLVVDYRLEPAPPLPPETAQWADELLKRKGLR